MRFKVIFCTIFFTIFICSSLLATYRVSICAIFQNEALFFKEWIEFHKLQGVEHFYLYNHLSTDDFQSVLQPYIESGEVTLKDWLFTYENADHKEWINIQCNAYKDCLDSVGTQSQWIAFIDIDEFLFCVDGMPLWNFLLDYREFGGVCVNWLKFGTSNVIDVPEDKCMIEVLTRCMPHNDPENFKVKSIVQPRYVKACVDPHTFRYKNSKIAVTVNKKQVAGQKSKEQSLDKLRINHYWTRTVSHFKTNKLPSSQKRRPKKYSNQNIMNIAEKCNQDEDFVILRFVEPLRLQMGLDKLKEEL